MWRYLLELIGDAIGLVSLIATVWLLLLLAHGYGG